MQRKNILLLAAILWLFTTGCWVVTLGIDFYFGSTPEWLMAMHGLTALVSFIAAITSYIRFRQSRDDVEV